jgi:hypothetical protein
LGALHHALGLMLQDQAVQHFQRRLAFFLVNAS